MCSLKHSLKNTQQDFLEKSHFPLKFPLLALSYGNKMFQRSGRFYVAHNTACCQNLFPQSKGYCSTCECWWSAADTALCIRKQPNTDLSHSQSRDFHLMISFRFSKDLEHLRCFPSPWCSEQILILDLLMVRHICRQVLKSSALRSDRIGTLHACSTCLPAMHLALLLVRWREICAIFMLSYKFQINEFHLKFWRYYIFGRWSQKYIMVILFPPKH